MSDNNTTQQTDHVNEMARECTIEQGYILTEDELKIIALAKHLDIDPEDIEQSDYDDTTFDVDGYDYLVCTDEEADDRAGDYIKESLWAFNAGFIIDHTDLPYEATDMITGFQDKCEDANDTIAALITDMDEFIEDAICADGRGHFMGSYDGEENEEDGFYIYRM